jgi:hypothetical protein
MILKVISIFRDILRKRLEKGPLLRKLREEFLKQLLRFLILSSFLYHYEEILKISIVMP